VKYKLALAGLLLIALPRSSSALGSDGDLILGFRDDGSDLGTGTGTNVTVDIGSFTQFVSGGMYYDPGVTESLGINLANDGLKSIYGNNYLSDTGLYFGVVGTNGTASNQDELFVSAKATGGTPGTPNSTAWTIQSASAQNTQANAFQVLELVNLAPPNGVSDTPTTTSYSWTRKENNSGGLSFGTFSTSAFEAVAPGGAAMDLYALNPQAGGPGVGNPGAFLGTFSIDSGGHLDFTAAAIPEPSAFTWVLGSAALGFVALRRARAGAGA